jgi:hypothetical protein
MPSSGLFREATCGLLAMPAWSGAMWSAGPAAAADELAVSIVHLTREEGTRLPPLSLLEPREGEGLTFSTWNQQMRQPILLAAPCILVSPQERFLHQRTPLDSLRFDESESNLSPAVNG